jgi:flavin reductase (DIM6/NTAB) family NADH-FMN oxidoreductase RutF
MSDKVSLHIDNNVLRLLGFSPVTLITTVGKDGSINAAPYGWITVVDYDPPQLLCSVNMKHDTYRNVLETEEFVVNIPNANMIREIWITQKPFPYGINELEEADLTPLPSEKVKPPRIKECKAHIECKVIWTKIIGSACLVLGNIEAISIDKEMEELDEKARAIALNRPIFFSYQREGSERKWMFGEIGKIHKLIEKNGEVEIKTRKV